jgi:hypothetical protein
MATIGGASLRWRTPGAATAGIQNQRLSVARANAVSNIVEAGLAQRNLSGVTSVQRQAIGSILGRALGLSDDDNSQMFRATSLTAYESGGRVGPNTPGGPGTGGAPNLGDGGSGPVGIGPQQGTGANDPFANPGPGGPGTGTRNSPSLQEGKYDWGQDTRHDPTDPTKNNELSATALPMVPDLLNRPTMGWDSGISIGGTAEAGAGVGAGVSASYSIPVATAAFPADAEVPLRAVSGIVKLAGDFTTGNVPGAIRDGVGLAGAFVPTEIVNAVADGVFPLPPGYTD